MYNALKLISDNYIDYGDSNKVFNEDLMPTIIELFRNAFNNKDYKFVKLILSIDPNQIYLNIHNVILKYSDLKLYKYLEFNHYKNKDYLLTIDEHMNNFVVNKQVLKYGYNNIQFVLKLHISIPDIVDYIIPSNDINYIKIILKKKKYTLDKIFSSANIYDVDYYFDKLSHEIIRWIYTSCNDFDIIEDIREYISDSPYIDRKYIKAIDIYKFDKSYIDLHITCPSK